MTSVHMELRYELNLLPLEPEDHIQELHPELMDEPEEDED